MAPTGAICISAEAGAHERASANRTDLEKKTGTIRDLSASGVDGKPAERNNPRFFAPVAQLDRVPGYELGGREFESLRARQTSEGCFGTLFIFRTPRVAASETRCVTRRGKPRSPMLS